MTIVMSPLDFDVFPDGSLDSGPGVFAAFQKAIQYNEPLEVPPGTYRLKCPGSVGNYNYSFYRLNPYTGSNPPNFTKPTTQQTHPALTAVILQPSPVNGNKAIEVFGTPGESIFFIEDAAGDPPAHTHCYMFSTV
jgi:hypothetical protein